MSVIGVGQAQAVVSDRPSNNNAQSIPERINPKTQIFWNDTITIRPSVDLDIVAYYADNSGNISATPSTGYLPVYTNGTVSWTPIGDDSILDIMSRVPPDGVRVWLNSNNFNQSNPAIDKSSYGLSNIYSGFLGAKNRSNIFGFSPITRYGRDRAKIYRIRVFGVGHQTLEDGNISLSLRNPADNSMWTVARMGHFLFSDETFYADLFTKPWNNESFTWTDLDTIAVAFTASPLNLLGDNAEAYYLWLEVTIVPVDDTEELPSLAIPPHHTTHELGGTDPIQVSMNQVTDLVNINQEGLAASDDVTIIGNWNFNAVAMHINPVHRININRLRLRPIERPISPEIGWLYCDANDTFYYYYTETGWKQLAMKAPDTFGFAQAQTRMISGFGFKFAQAQTFIRPLVGVAQAQAKIGIFGAQYIYFNTTPFFQTGTGAEYIYWNHVPTATSGSGAEYVYWNDSRAFSDSAQAQADIKQQYQAYSQARTKITAPTVAIGAQEVYWTTGPTLTNHAQAQAEIKFTTTRFAQAQSSIRIIQVAHGAQEVYWNTGPAFTYSAQAMAYVGHFKSAQAQARIVSFNTYSFAQAQVRIDASKTVYAQAQAKINAFGVQAYGQAQAFLGGVSRTAQAQANILSRHPFFVAEGSQGDSTGNATPGLPTGWAVNDLLLLFIETSNDDPTPTAPAGWQFVDNSPQGSDSGDKSTKLSIMWKRAESGESAPTIVDVGNHIISIIQAYRNVVLYGTPWVATSAGTYPINTNESIVVPGATTTIDGCLVVIAASAGWTVFQPENQWGGSWANADLVQVTELSDFGSEIGNRGNIGIVNGYKILAGTYGSTTVEHIHGDQIAKAFNTIALRPPGINTPVFAQAQAYIKPIIAVGQAQAYIKAPTNSFAQAQAQIIGTSGFTGELGTPDSKLSNIELGT